jgi:hypothetical protein
MSQSSPNVSQLFKTAQQEGTLSPQAAKTLQLVDVGANIQNALGIPAFNVQASEVVLVTMYIDDSGSIRFASNSQAVRDGHNLVIDSLIKSKQGDNILVHTKYFNGTILYPYCPIKDAIKMDTHNYDPNGGTPLYDETVMMLGTVMAKAQEFADNGVPVRTISLVMTDGHDEHSRKIKSPSQIAPVVKNMLMQENHIVAAMGIDDGGCTNFTEIFKEMGLEDRWILTPGNTEKEIRSAFSLFSSSAVRASQSATHFSKTALGGFTN